MHLASLLVWWLPGTVFYVGMIGRRPQRIWLTLLHQHPITLYHTASPASPLFSLPPPDSVSNPVLSNDDKTLSYGYHPRADNCDKASGATKTATVGGCT